MSEPTVLHRTEGWLVLDKPAGWHCTAQTGGNSRTIEAWLREHVPACADLPECGLVHRLDSGTTGCLVVALAKAERNRLRTMFASASEPRIHKSYMAVVRRGLAPAGKFALSFAGRHKSSAKVTVRPRGEPATMGECSWQVIGPSRFLGHDVVQVELLGPGRRHQIRAGLAYGGHPLLGDQLYGGSPGAPCPALHAASVAIDGVRVESPADERFTPATQPSRPS